MRVGVFGAWATAAAACGLAFACGTQLAPPPGEEGGDGGVDATEPAEPPLEEFGCGAARCRVTVQVCCIVSSAPTCAPIADGCDALLPEAGAEGGADAAPPPKPLRCTTYRVCNYGNDCCWSASQGSQCKNDCEADELALCQAGDGCGYGFSCESIPDDPLGPGVRRCVPDGSGSSSSGWSGGSSGGSGGF